LFLPSAKRCVILFPLAPSVGEGQGEGEGDLFIPLGTT
jgi:hypothetical protein